MFLFLKIVPRFYFFKEGQMDIFLPIIMLGAMLALAVYYFITI